jgi:hypothetical protein
MTREELESLAKSMLDNTYGSYGTSDALAIHRLGNCIVLAALLLSPSAASSRQIEEKP